MLRNTIPRPKSLDQLPIAAAAAAVDLYLGVPAESSTGWALRTFHVGPQDALREALRAHGDGGGRAVPEGDYIALRNDADGGWCMMSNTPDEMQDHLAFMENAKGRVLVTGLGLSCVVSGLLANENVEHIDVVELDEGIIEMVGPAFVDEDRVTIHHGDAMTYEFPDDARWDYAWHDIWRSIDPGNLHTSEGEAENGIGYDKLLMRYADRVPNQGAWALPHSLLMEEAELRADREANEWNERWQRSTTDERYAMQFEWMARMNPIMAALNDGTDPWEGKVEVMRKLAPPGSDMEKDMRERSSQDNVVFVVDAPPLLNGLRAEGIEELLMDNYLSNLGFDFDGEFVLSERVYA